MLPPFSIKLTSISNSRRVYGDSVPAITSKVEEGLLTSSRTAGFDNIALTLYEVSGSFSSAP